MKNKPYYGYPIRLFLMNIPISLLIILLLILSIIIRVYIIYMIILMLLLILSLLYGIFTGKTYEKIKKFTTKNLLNFAEIQGNEKVLDLGTGAGIVAIHFAKEINDGMVYGIDRWKFSPIVNSFLLFHMITGSNINNANKNAKLENVSKKCNFISYNITEKLDFPDNHFNIICSNDSLYFIRNEKERISLFIEINRLLKKDGRILFCEPERSYSGWNIYNVKNFFKNLNYNVNIFPVTVPKGWTLIYILVGKKI